jgi:DNA-binding winged helix-turn-helix (wHTH) protein/TolB-like protein/Tfp pilus assembly protein PilF
MDEIAENSFTFSGFRIDVARRLVLDRDGDPVQLTPKVFDLLFYLIQNRGKLLTKDELMAADWPDTIVEESNLTQNISILRRALGDVKGGNALIVTVPGRGYKFVADVTTDGIFDKVASPIKLPPAGRTDRRPIYVGLVIGLVAVAAGVFYILTSKRTSADPPRILAILPFRPLVNDNSDEALEIGMTDTLIARMSSDPGLVLRPLSSVRPFSRADIDPQAAGRQLGADTVLEGSVQRWGDKIRVNVRLINVQSGEPMWSATFDDKYTDIFAVEDAISGKVAEALRLRLGSASGVRQTQNVEAYRLYLQGRLFQFRSTPQEIRQAIAFYEKALALDPNYALAYAGIADAYRMLPITSDVAASDAFPRSKAAALKALELDDRSSQSHVALGYVYSWYEWNWPAAESEMRKAIELDHNDPDAHRGLSILLTVTGRHDEAINEMRAARELDPLSLATNALEAQALHYAGRDDEAVDRLNKTFEIDPNFWIARLMLARIYIGEKRWSDALTELEKARTASGGNSEAISLTAYTLAQSGHPDEARKMIDELQKPSDQNYLPSYNIALAYNGLGDSEQALHWLDDAVERHDVRMILLKVEHKWDNLRSDGRFISIMRRVGF